jgi:hypothetical protein
VKRWWWGVGAALAVAGLWLLGPSVLRKLETFRVRRVEVLGARYLDAAEVTRALALRPAASVFDDTGPLAARALAIRGVRFAAVRTRLPGTLEVEIEEFEPVALATIDGKLTLVDRRGRSLPFDPTRATTDLPVADADPAVAALIDRVRDADPGFFGTITLASRERNVIVVETARHRVLFRVGASIRDIQAAGVVLAEVVRRRMAVTELDARFEGRVVVRGRRA